MLLEGRVALITGGARGIGKVSSILFAKEGATVAICGSSDIAGGQDTIKQIEEAGGKGYYFKVNIAKRDEVNAMVESIRNECGRIDILVNNAGITRDAMFHKMTEEQWDQVIDVNLKGTFNCTKAVVPIMIGQGRGKIINVSSVVATYGNLGQANYIASKGAIVAMTKVLSKELGPKGINVNCVAPGFIETEMTAKVPEHILDGMRQKCPFKRLGRPDEIAKAFLWLASDESEFVNGALIPVDGGLVIG